MLRSGGREVTGQEAERIVQNGGSVQVGNATVEGSNVSWHHNIRLADGTLRDGGNAADSLRIASQNSR